jgi:hypothetical protein
MTLSIVPDVARDAELMYSPLKGGEFTAFIIRLDVDEVKRHH